MLPVPASKRAGRRLVRGLLEGDVVDHVAAALPGRHRLEDVRLAEQGADAGRREHLVPGERSRSRSRAPGRRPACARRPARRRRSTRAPCRCAICDHLARGHDRPERVRDLGERDDPRPRAEQRLVLLEDRPGRASSTGATRRRAPFSAAELLPGDDVGVVLEPGDDDLVARADVAAAPALRDQVDRLGRAADEDDLSDRRRVEEAAHLVARRPRRRRWRARPARARRGGCWSSRARRSRRGGR